MKHYINVGDAVTVQQKPYQILYSQRELVKKELDCMLEARMVRPSTSPWASPIVLVPKNDGDVHFVWTTENSTSWSDLMLTPCIQLRR